MGLYKEQLHAEQYKNAPHDSVDVNSKTLNLSNKSFRSNQIRKKKKPTQGDGPIDESVFNSKKKGRVRVDKLRK